jgi:hypothetical protein
MVDDWEVALAADDQVVMPDVAAHLLAVIAPGSLHVVFSSVIGNSVKQYAHQR